MLHPARRARRCAGCGLRLARQAQQTDDARLAVCFSVKNAKCPAPYLRLLAMVRMRSSFAAMRRPTAAA